MSRHSSPAALAPEPTLPLEWQVPGGLPAVPPATRHLRLVTPATREASDLPAPGPWVARLAPAILEVAAGERPPGQLMRWVSREHYVTLCRRHAAALHHPVGKDRPPQCRKVRSVRICPIAPGIVEASAVIQGATRARAVALRLEAVRGRWLATAVELG